MPIFTLTTLDPISAGRLRALATSLAHAVDAKGRYIRHGESVARHAIAIAERLAIPRAGQQRLELAALMHDVGKLTIPDELLLAPRRLALHEFEVVKYHSVAGHRMLLDSGLAMEGSWVMHHHERWDGSGYPTGLRADAIPLPSRILAVADAFDVMLAARPYKPPWAVPDAVRELRHCAGSQFDPAVVNALVDALEARGLDTDPEPRTTWSRSTTWCWTTNAELPRELIPSITANLTLAATARRN